jgi:polar amino acid transport system permease protein
VSNEVITLVKDTSLVYVVGLGELLRAGKIASNRDASLVPLVVVALFYLILTAILTKGFKSCEDKYSYYQ